MTNCLTKKVENRSYSLAWDEMGKCEFVNATGEVLELDRDAAEFLMASLPVAMQTKRRKSLPPNAGQAWTPELDAQLKESWACEKDSGLLAKKFGRTRGAIQSRLERLGLIEARNSLPVETR